MLSYPWRDSAPKRVQRKQGGGRKMKAGLFHLKCVELG